jgi:hypothetical protein
MLQARIKGLTQHVLSGCLSTPTLATANKQLITKLNGIIVAIAKHDWPAAWPTFIQDMVAAADTSDIVCSNTLDIIKRLSEEIFDYSKNNLTSGKVRSGVLHCCTILPSPPPPPPSPPPAVRLGAPLVVQSLPLPCHADRGPEAPVALGAQGHLLAVHDQADGVL